MLLTSLHVENLLTFDTFELVLDGQSQVVVGPNGAGKSNIVRVIDVVAKALDWAADGVMGTGSGSPAEQVLRSFAAARHHGQASQRESVVRLAVELTTATERDRLATYVRAAILNVLLQDLRSVTQPDEQALDQWIEAGIPDDALSPLFTGTIVLKHSGMPHVPWEVSYEFTHGDVRYRWLLTGARVTPSIIRVDAPPPPAAGVTPTTWPERLLGVSQSDDLPVALPSPLPDFTFDALCPAAHEMITAPVMHTGARILDQRFLVFRRAIEVLGLPLPENAPNRTFSMAHPLALVFGDGVIIVGEQFRGLGVGGSPPQQAGPYAWDVLVSPYRSRGPAQLPMRLFGLKNGGHDERARFAEIQTMFTRLAPGRACDVTFQAITQTTSPAPIGAGLVAMVTADSETDGEPGRPAAFITVVVGRTDDVGRHPNDLPIQLHGAGTWDALVLAEVLVESSHGRVVILDEPAVTFHPSWQRALRSRLGDSQGQLLLVTHSAHLVPMGEAGDLARLVRVENEAGHTRPHRLDPQALSDDQVRQISREFALSADAIALLFARGVVLVEGDTEAGALPGWFAKGPARDRRRSPAELDVEIYSVDGDTRFRPYLTVLNAFGIPWVVVCDGAAFDIEHRAAALHVFRQVLDADIDVPDLTAFLARVRGGGSTPTMSRTLFDEQRKLGESHGILTLAPGWTTASKKVGRPGDESFEAFIDSIDSTAREQASQQVGDSKVRVGRWIAENRDCPGQVSELYKHVISALQHRGLTTLDN